VKYSPQIHHRRSIRLQGYDYSQAGAYFVTICAWQRGCLFGDVAAGEMRLNAVGKIVEWEWRRLGEGFPNVELGEFVVMPNHIHGIIFIHAAERATRHEQNLTTNGIVGLPDEAAAGIVGSPLRGGSNVGATQADLCMPNSGTDTQSNMDMPGADGSPRRGRTNTPDMECPAVDGGLDGPGRATRYEQNLSINGNMGLPDEASAGIVGSPLRGPGGPPSQSLGAIIGQWKSRVTKRTWKLPGMRGMRGIPVWQRNYYEHIIRDEADYQRIAQYIQTNPLRWEQDQLHPQAPPNQFNQDRTHGD
jgi:REP element-mobilizing transposase RayT